jgi:AcrR family transcriptional regulator
MKNRDDIINLRRNQLTTATYRVVSKKGYYNFTIRDIAREAGLSTGLVHYYFKSKEDLLFTLLKVMNDNLRLVLNRELARSSDPGEKLLIFINQAFSLVEREKNYFYVLIDFWTRINHNERIRKANVKLYKSYRDEISKILEEGIQKGLFERADAAYLSTVIISLIQGTIIQYVIDGGAFDYAEYTDRLRGQVLDMVMKK